VGFAAKYQCKNLIYYEHYRDVRDATKEIQLEIGNVLFVPWFSAKNRLERVALSQ